MSRPQLPPSESTTQTPKEPRNPPRLAPQLIERFMAEFRGGFPGSSFVDRLDTKQLGKLLDQTSDDSRRQHELDIQRNWMGFALLLSIPILVFGLCFVFLHYGKGELLREIIALLIGLGGGGAGGYTLGRVSKRSSDA